MTNSKKHLIDTVLYHIEDGKDCRELLDLISNADKYRWHNLRKEPNDLPCEEYDMKLCECAYFFPKTNNVLYGEALGMDIRSDDGVNIIGWRLHEPFEVEE